jgi:hypothetical protein
MSNLSINNLELYQNINFTEKHIGGQNNDTSNSFNNQLNIISNSNDDYQRTLNYNNKIERDKNKNDNYVERLDNEKRTTVYRINNYPTYVDDINFSNPVIYPKDYNMYFDYLQKKNINQINTQVIKKKNYINIDSQNRNKFTSLNIREYINLIDYSLEFENQATYLKIYIENSKKYFINNENIILRGFKNYTNYYKKLNFFFTHNSPTVILDLKPNFNEIIPYIDIFLKINGVTYEDKSSWKNIPLNLINQQHKISLKEINNELRMSFDLPINFYSDNDSDKTLVSDCLIEFYSLGNYPINLINSNTPISSNYLNPYLIISEVGNDYIKLNLKNIISVNKNIDLDGKWDNDKFRTGTNIQIGIIGGFIQGYPNSNDFVVNLENSYNNVCSIKMISSEIPNVIQNINSKQSSIEIENNIYYIQPINNKFYWDNVVDSGVYSIDLDSGFYTYEELKKIIEYKVSKVKRNFIFNDLYLYDYNIINIEFSIQTNTTVVNFYNLYMYPDCLFSLNEIDENNTDNFIIRIHHINHNLKSGDMIIITDSIDYFTIKSDYINDPNGHEIINVINNNYYQIKIKNINKITDVGNTKGGKNIKIKYAANFRLFFNYADTFGALIGFKLNGLQTSITNYSSNYQNYTITNNQPYYKDLQKIIIVENTPTPFDLTPSYNKINFRYVLLQVEKLNNNYNPNGPSYFYKILLNGSPNSYLFNSLVQSPIYFNPPIKSIADFKFKFILPDGSLANFGNLDLSFTLELTTIDNIPENTNIATYIARL